MKILVISKWWRELEELRAEVRELRVEVDAARIMREIETYGSLPPFPPESAR